MQRALITAFCFTGLFIAGPHTVQATGVVSGGRTVVSNPVPAPSTGVGDDITIETRDVRLTGSYFPPKSKSRSGRAPGVLLVHEAGADRTQLNNVALSLNKKGFGVLTLDLRGHGGSMTDRFDWLKCDADAQSKLWQQAVRDVEEGAAWLLSQRDIHSTNLSLVGFRSGCALAARHAENDENVVGMALISPKAMDFGFDVSDSIQQLSGLPTVLVDVDNAVTERMATEANARSPKDPYVSVVTVKSKGTNALDDSKTASRVSSFLGDVAMPKKGRE